jgi:hypothetical protein
MGLAGHRIALELWPQSHKDAYMGGSSDGDNESISEANCEVEHTGPRKTRQNKAISR